MILLTKTLDGAGTVVKDNIQMKTAETAVRGEALTITTTGLTKTATTGLPDAIYLGKEDTTNGRKDKYVLIRNDDEFEIDITGDASTVVIGTAVYCLTSDGLCLDAATATGGHVKVCDVNVAKKKAIVQFK
jgi:hypothetical protein